MTMSLFALLSFAQAPPTRSTNRERQTTNDPTAARLHNLFEAEWNYDMQQDPTAASELGDRRWNDRWEDVSLTAIRDRRQHYVAVLQDLKLIDHAQLSPADQLNYDLFKKRYEDRLEWSRFHLYLVPVNQMDGIQTISQLADALPFQSVKDYEDWIA